MAQFMAAPWPQKHLKIYNLRTTNATKMKLGTIMYLHETFHLTKDLGVALRGVQGRDHKTLKKIPKIGFLGIFHRIFNNISKPETYVIVCLALDHL